MKKTLSTLLTVMIASCVYGQEPSAHTPPTQTEQPVLTRRYVEGEKLTYSMHGLNERWQYTVQADAVVKKDGNGTFFEEYRWSKLVSDGHSTELTPAGITFRQALTLDPASTPSFPDLAKTDTRLIGPITDMMTFYADLWLAIKTGQLKHAGDHFYYPRPQPNSWADGNYVLLGEDAIDFDFTLKAVDTQQRTATLVVKHIPPKKPAIKIPAEWMRAPVADDTANNWVEVQRVDNGKYRAAVGKETFNVKIVLRLADGKIISASLDNSVQTVERECTDSALATCGDLRPHAIRRHVELSLIE